MSSADIQKKLHAYALSPGWITGLLEIRHVPSKYSGSLSTDSCTQTVLAMSGAAHYAPATSHTINLFLSECEYLVWLRTLIYIRTTFIRNADQVVATRNWDSRLELHLSKGVIHRVANQA